jgi:RND superfamily putative drug exporter
LRQTARVPARSVTLRWLIVTAWAVAVPVLSVTLPALSSVAQSGTAGLIPASAPSARAARLAASFEGTDPSVTAELVAERAAGPLTAADEAAIGRAEAAARHVPGVTEVRDAGNSPDRRAHEAVIVTSPGDDTPASLTGRIRAVFPAARPPAGLAFHLTGPLAQTADEGGVVQAGQVTALSVIVILALLVIVFRAVLAPLLVLVPAAASLAVAMPLIAEASRAGLAVSPLTQELLIVLLLGAGTNYGLFLAFRIREELSHGASPAEATGRALGRVGAAITCSAVTVVAALLSLLLSGFGVYRGLGPAMAIGVGVMLLASLTLTPALFTIAGSGAFWPRPSHPAGPHTAGLWAWVAARVGRHPLAALAAGLALLGALGAGLAGYRTTGLNDNSPAGSDAAAGAAVIAAHFPPASAGGDEAVFRLSGTARTDRGALARLHDQLASDPVFRSVTGPGVTVNGARLIRQPVGTGQFVSPDGRTVQFYVALRAGPPGSPVAIGAVPAARAAVAAAARRAGVASGGLAGLDADSYDLQEDANSALVRVIPAVLALIFVLLVLLLRSLVAPWYLVGTTALSYLAALGFAMIVFVHLGAAPGLVFVLPFAMFVFAMALGQDYNILLLSRIREDYDILVISSIRERADAHPPLRHALTHALSVTGPAITSAGIILAGTFAALGVAGGSAQARELGLSISFGVLLDTFGVRALLVPAIAAMLGRRNWWPSRPGLTRRPAGPRYRAGA